jgi:hypothetical protein
VRDTAEFKNIPPLIGNLISGGMATLAELQSVYSLEDAFMMQEVLLLKNYHSWLSTKQNG